MSVWFLMMLCHYESGSRHFQESQTLHPVTVSHTRIPSHSETNTKKPFSILQKQQCKIHNMLTVIEVRLLLCVVYDVVLFTEVLTEVLSIATRSTWIESLLWPGLTAARAEVRLETIPSKSASQRKKNLTITEPLMVVTPSYEKLR